MFSHLAHPVASRNGLLMPCIQQHGHPPSVPEPCLQRLSLATRTHDRHCDPQYRVKARAGGEPGPLDALKAAVSCRTKHQAQGQPDTVKPWSCLLAQCEEEGVDLVPMAYLQDEETWEDLLDNEEVVWDPTLDVPEHPAFSSHKTGQLLCLCMMPA